MSGDAFPVKPETNEYTALSFLVAHRGTEFTLGEIADDTGICESATTEAVIQLRDWGLVNQSEDSYYVSPEQGGELAQRLASLDAVVRLFEPTPADDTPDEQRNMVGSSARSIQGAIAERPRSIRQHPLLEAVYERHDQIISDHIRGKTLEVAFGRHAHPHSDVAVDIASENTQQAVGVEAITGDLRSLPFPDGVFETVIGRRFIHHLPPEDRAAMLSELRRVLSQDGRLIILEGTPGMYRKVAKGMAFKLGVLGEDTDEHGHLSADELKHLLQKSEFEIKTSCPLGSPFMPLSISEENWSKKLLGVYQRTQWIRWWTFMVCLPTAESTTPP